MIKHPRQKGMRFESKVRADLESKCWIVSKWQNNVEFETIKHEGVPDFEGDDKVVTQCGLITKGRLIPAKQGRYRLTSTGFPDFSCFRNMCTEAQNINHEYILGYEIIGVECKINGYLSKEEKEKCKWLLENNIFSKILVASRGDKRGTIKYEEFKNA